MTAVPARVPEPSPSQWAALRRPVFRALWTAQAASLVGTWAQTVGAQWYLTTESGRPELVALVQTATSLPVLLLALPAGVLADLLDRRRLIVVTQTGALLVVAALAAVTLTGRLTPTLLLMFTAALGVGVALTNPAWQASVPELVVRAELPAAAALNGIAVNAARAVGPAVGGVLVAAAGVGWTFAFNAATYVAFVLALLTRWHPPPRAERQGSEGVGAAVRLGVGYVRNAPAMRRVLARTGLWALPGSALWALLPLVASGRLGLGSSGYGVLFASLGLGAVAGAALLGPVRARVPPGRVLAVAGLVYAGALAVLALGRSTPLAVVVLLLAGGAWLSVLSTLNATAQLILPGWVRARALATYLLVFSGGQALGAALWGAVAGRASVEVALLAAAVVMVLGTATLRWVRLPDPAGIDPAPSAYWPEPHLVLDPDPRGSVLVTVEYRVPEERVEEFVAAMQYVARSRRRTGARRWELHRDGADPGRFLESYTVASWAEHLRQHEQRLTLADQRREEAVQALLAEPPRASHLFSV